MTTPTPSQQVASEQFMQHSRWPGIYRAPTWDEWLQEVQQLKRDLAAAQDARQRAEALAEEYRKLLAETLKPGAYGIGSTLAQRIDAALEGKL